VTDLIILKLGETPADVVAWGAFAAGRFEEAGRVENVSALTDVTGRFSEDARIVAVLPGEQVALRDIPSPPRQAAKLRAAAGYLLEDELAETIDDLHLVITSVADGARAFAISKAVMKSWIDAFAEAGVTVASMSVDFALIGGDPSVCVIAGDRGRIIASRGKAGFAAELALADIVAPAFLQAAGDAAVVSYGAHEHAGRWAAAPVERRPLAHEADLIALFGANIAAKGEHPEFLSGEFRPKRQRSAQLGAWRRPGALAASLAAALVALGAASGLRDWRIAERYEATAEALHKSAFPTFEGGDIRSHVRGLLASGAKTAGFLEMTARLTAGLEAHPGVSIERIRYDAARGQYIFSIRSTSDAGIEAFRTGLLGSGIEASDNGGYRRTGDQWVGEMAARAR
jgi:general secretion pathway protein L